MTDFSRSLSGGYGIVLTVKKVINRLRQGLDVVLKIRIRHHQGYTPLTSAVTYANNDGVAG